MLVRHREFVHPTELAAEGSARAAQKAAERAPKEDDLYTTEGFLRRHGAAPEARRSAPGDFLSDIFPADPGQPVAPWDRELQDRGHS
jgi:hypothetical protein